MAVIKVACPKCGQKVSGDESFYGRSVNCPVCTSKIDFPAGPESLAGSADHAQSDHPVEASLPTAIDPVPPASSSSPAPHYPDPPTRPDDSPAPVGGNLPPAFDEDPIPTSSSPQVGAETAPPSQIANQDELTDEGEVPSPLLGTIALITGILNTLSICIFSLVLAPAAIIFGHLALTRAKHSPVKPAPGHTQALIGVILGYTGVVFTILALVIALVFRELLTSLLPVQEPVE